MIVPTRKPGGKQKFNVLDAKTGKVQGPFATKAAAQKVEDKFKGRK